MDVDFDAIAESVCSVEDGLPPHHQEGSRGGKCVLPPHTGALALDTHEISPRPEPSTRAAMPRMSVPPWW